MKTAIYVRTAQENEVGIKSQIEFCKPIQNDGEYVVYSDNGYSAHDKNRPAFNRMIKDIEDGSINKVVVYSIDRLGRSFSDIYSFWKFTEAHNISFSSVKECFTTENCGMRPFEFFFLALNEMEKENHNKSIRQGWFCHKQKKVVQ